MSCQGSGPREASCDLWAPPQKGKGGVLWSWDVLGSNPPSIPRLQCSHGQAEGHRCIVPQLRNRHSDPEASQGGHEP